MAFRSACFGLKFTLYDVRGWLFVYTSVLAIWAAFTAFQELINGCTQWVLAAESLDE